LQRGSGRLLEWRRVRERGGAFGLKVINSKQKLVIVVFDLIVVDFERGDLGLELVAISVEVSGARIEYIVLLLLLGLKPYIFSLQLIVYLRLGLKMAFNGSQMGHHLLNSICEVRIVVCLTVIVHSSWAPWPD